MCKFHLLSQYLKTLNAVDASLENKAYLYPPKEIRKEAETLGKRVNELAKSKSE